MVLYLRTTLITEEWGFSLSCCPPVCPPAPCPWPRADSVQVLVDSDKTNLFPQNTIVRNSLEQAWMSSTSFRSGWHETTKLCVRTRVLCAWSWERRGGRWMTCLLIMRLNLELLHSRWVARGKALDTSVFNSATNRHVNNSICAL